MRDKGFLKRIFLTIGCILCLSCFCWFNLIRVKEVSAVEHISFLEFESQIIEMVEQDDYSGVEIEEDVTFNALINALGVEPEFMVSAYSDEPVDSGVLEFEEIDEICAEFGYEVQEGDDGYTAYSTFMLKRLVVTGNVGDYYGASKVITGYRDYTILCYDTEEQTEYAYNQLTQNDDLIVTIDTVVSAQSNVEPVESEDLNLMATSHNSWGAKAIGVDEYIDYLGTISQEAVVVVIDSGINTSHQMFSERFLYSDGSIVGYSYYNGNSLSLGEGSSNTQYGKGYSSTTYFEDDNGHGTHVAGIVCDLTPSNVKILPIRALDNNGSGSTLAVEAALWRVYEVYASQYKIAAINISIGIDLSSSTTITTTNIENLNGQIDPIIDDLLDDKNILTVVAAGNKNPNIESVGQPHVSYSRSWLAGCENTITVTALKQSGTSYVFDNSYSDYGTSLSTSRVNISAPGTAINSAYVGSATQMAVLQGTSMASPHVAAVVALLCLDNRYWTGNTSNYEATEIRERLYDLAVDLGSTGYDVYYGEGMVSLENFNGSISFTKADKTYTYDGDYHNIAVSVSGLSSYTIKYRTASVATYYSSISHSVFNNAFKNVTSGQMIVYFVISTTETGYGDSYGYAYLAINARPITISIDSKSSVYGSSLASLTYSITSGSLASGESLSDLNILLSTTATSVSVVKSGGYPITGTYSNANYTVTFENGTYTITPKSITVIIGNGTSKYGDIIDLSSVTATCTSLVGGDNISSLNLDFSVTGVSTSSNAGTYSGVISATSSNPNYNATFVKGDYIVTRRILQISTKQSSVYGDAISVDNSIYTITGDGVIGEDSLGVVFEVNGIDSKSSAIAYDDKITMSYSNANYSISAGSLIYEITKRPIVITINDRECEYGDTIEDDDTLYTTNGNEIAGDNLGVDLTVNVASRIISGTCSNTNYAPTFVSGIIEITPRKISISTYQKGEYCEEIQLDESEYELVSGTLANAEDDLQLRYSTTATNASDVGTYTITLEEHNSNYDITLTSGVYEIIERKLNVEIDNQTSQYGDEINTLTYKIYDEGALVSESNLLNFDITLICSATDESGVDSFEITAQNNDATRYDITFSNGTYTITERDITILINNLSSEYGDELLALTYSVKSGSLATKDTLDDLNISISTTASNTSVVQDYPISATYNNDNYNVTFEGGTYSIVKRNISIEKIQQSEYGQAVVVDNTYTIKEGSLAEFDRDLGIIFSTEATSESAYGQYPITMEYTNTNYNVTLLKGVYYIAGKVVTITIGNKTSVYGDSISVDDVDCIVVGDVVSLEELQLQFNTDATIEKVVGTYDITAICNNENYAIDFDPGKYEITKRPITVKTTQSGIYGNEPILTGSYEVVEGNIVSGDEVTIEFNMGADSKSEVNDYLLTLKSCSNSNYNVSVTLDSFYTVEARPITIQIGNRTSKYGDEITQNNTDYVVTSENKIVNSDNLNIQLNIKLPQANSYGYYNVGNYYIEGTCNNKNYDVDFRKGLYSITRRVITLTLDNAQGVYGDVEPITEPSGTVTPSMPVGEGLESLNLTLVITESITSKTNVGTYIDVITAKYINSNYNVTIVKASYEIIARPIKISTTQYGEYGKSPQISNTDFIVEEGSIIEGDTLGLFFSTTATSSSGVETIHEITLDNYSNKNYDISLIKGEYIINPRAITVQINNASSVYGEELAQLKYALKYGNLVSGDTLNDLNIVVSTTATNLSGVESSGYPITATYNNANYTVTFEDGTYTIVPKNIEVKINDSTSIYGDSLVELTYNLKSGESLVGDDTLQDLNIEVSTNASTTGGVLESGYPITGTYESENYIVTFTNGIYRITPREVHIVVSLSGEYGKTPMLENVDYSVVAGDVVDNDYLGLTFQTTATNTSEVETYDITLKSVANRNYNVILDSGTYKITAKDITIVLNNAFSQYGDSLSTLTYGLKSGFELAPNDSIDKLNIIPTTTATNLSVVKQGGYPITAEYNNKNYNVTFETGTYTIKPRQIVVKINNANSVYGQELSALSCELNSDSTLAWSDTFESLNIELFTVATNLSEVRDGGYQITGTYNNANYQITFINGVYTINPLEVTVNIQNQSGIYGDRINLNNNLYEIVSPSGISKEVLQVVLITEAMSNSPVGDYSINAFCNNRNYKIISQEGIYTINKRKLTIKLNNQEVKRFFEFKLDKNKYEIIEGQLVEGDGFTIEMNTDAKWYSWVGEYDLSAVCDNANYDIEIINAKVKVKISTTDIVAVIVGLVLVIFIIVKIILSIARKNKKSQEYVEIYNYWINKK